MIRIQKKHESLMDAASQLINAMKVKRSKRSILVQTVQCESVNAIDHEGLIILPSAAIQIKSLLT